MSEYRHSETARKLLRSLVPVICPPEAAPLADAIVDHMALTFAYTPSLVRASVVAGFTAYDLGSLPRYRKRAHRLTGAAAERYYESWRHGFTPVHRQFAQALNQLMSLSCYEQPEMMAAIGYRVAPWIEEVKHKRLKMFAEDIKKHDVDILAPDPLRPNVKAKQEVA